MRGKQEVFVTNANGCIVPTVHKLNQDGYYRARDPRWTGKGRKPLIMYHRLVWELANGAVPEGYELHHTCHCRCCCNLDHLQLIKISEHKAEHNSTRYLGRKMQAKAYWEAHGCTGIRLGEIYGVSFSSACRWIREWKRRD